MTKLSQKDLETVEKFCGSGYGKRLRGIYEKQKDNTVRIVNTGMVSSGKSSLYNILINSNEEFFPTGAARTTTKANFYDYGNISYVDTPGIDVRNEDDALAFSTIIESDIIMMIHNVRTGPLNRSETEWLEAIVKGMSSKEMIKSRLIFVISWKDTREKDDDYSELVGNLKKQIMEIVGVDIPIFEVSVKKYQQGVEKNKEKLVENSGINELKDYLEQYAVGFLEKKQSIIEEEYRHLMVEIKTMLDTEKSKKNRTKQQIVDSVKKNHASRENAWKQVYDYFVEKRNKLSYLQKEFLEIYRS